MQASFHQLQTKKYKNNTKTLRLQLINLLIRKGPNNSSKRTAKSSAAKASTTKTAINGKAKAGTTQSTKITAREIRLRGRKRSRATSITNNTMIHRPDSESSPSQTLMNRCRDQDRDRTIYTRPEVHFIKNPKGHNSTNNPSHSHREEGSNSPNITIRLACPGAGSSGT